MAWHTCLYIYGNFLRDLNIREFLIFVLFVKTTIFNIKTKTLPYLGLTDRRLGAKGSYLTLVRVADRII